MSENHQKSERQKNKSFTNSNKNPPCASLSSAVRWFWAVKLWKDQIHARSPPVSVQYIIQESFVAPRCFSSAEAPRGQQICSESHLQLFSATCRIIWVIHRILHLLPPEKGNTFRFHLVNSYVQKKANFGFMCSMFGNTSPFSALLIQFWFFITFSKTSPGKKKQNKKKQAYSSWS